MINNEMDEIKEIEILKWNFVENFEIDKENNNTKKTLNDEDKSILEQVFPPREWTSKNNNNNETKAFRQTISKDLPTRNDVRKLIKSLRDYEKLFKIKGKGVCDYRNNLYSLYFDEVLRQVLILDEEVGKLLYRIRNEYKNIVFIYKFMVDNGSIYVDNYLNLKSNIPELIKEVNELTIINEDIVTKYNIASQKYNDRLMEKQKKTENFKNNQIEINHKKQLSDIERSTAQLQEQLKGMSMSMATP